LNTQVHLRIAKAGAADDADLALLAGSWGLTIRDLAQTVGSAEGAPAGEPLFRDSKKRLAEMVDIVARVSGWAGGDREAVVWYRSQPLAVFGDRTPEYLVKSGQAAALRDYLDSLALPTEIPTFSLAIPHRDDAGSR
jgi:hypothetical protein